MARSKAHSPPVPSHAAHTARLTCHVWTCLDLMHCPTYAVTSLLHCTVVSLHAEAQLGMVQVGKGLSCCCATAHPPSLPETHTNTQLPYMRHSSVAITVGGCTPRGQSLHHHFTCIPPGRALVCSDCQHPIIHTKSHAPSTAQAVQHVSSRSTAHSAENIPRSAGPQ